jgi:nitronate monooxygenase
MREAAAREGKADRMQMWAGQAAKLARTEPAKELTQEIWEESKALLALK